MTADNKTWVESRCQQCRDMIDLVGPDRVPMSKTYRNRKWRHVPHECVACRVCGQTATVKLANMGRPGGDYCDQCAGV